MRSRAIAFFGKTFFLKESFFGARVPPCHSVANLAECLGGFSAYELNHDFIIPFSLDESVVITDCAIFF